MKVYFVKPGDTVDQILHDYAVPFAVFKANNPNIDYKHLPVGSRINVDKTTPIPLPPILKGEPDNDFQQYVCPHCKNIILIPR